MGLGHCIVSLAQYAIGKKIHAPADQPEIVISDFHNVPSVFLKPDQK